MEVWIGRDGERHGPYNEVDVRQWLRSGQVSGEDLGWYEGLADWQPLATLFPDEKPVDASIAPPLPQRSASATASGATTDYAGFWQRFGAWVIDLFVLLVPSIIAFYALGGLDAYKHFLAQMQANADIAAALREYALALQSASIATVVIGFVYYTLFEGSKWQATPGKLALHLRVTDLHGQRLTLGRAAARNAVRLTNIITGLIPFVCYLAVAWTQRKQGLHDLIAGTLVLNDRASQHQGHAPPSNRHDGSFSA